MGVGAGIVDVGSDVVGAAKLAGDGAFDTIEIVALASGDAPDDEAPQPIRRSDAIAQVAITRDAASHSFSLRGSGSAQFGRLKGRDVAAGGGP